MDQTKKGKLEQHENLDGYIADHPEITDEITEMVDDVTNLRQGIADIKVAEGIQGTPTKGITEQTKDFKEVIVRARSIIGSADPTDWMYSEPINI